MLLVINQLDVLFVALEKKETNEFKEKEKLVL